MRLLHLDKEGYISLTEFIGDKIPPYAILSHTWGPDDQEVTFQDLYQAAEERRRAAGLRSRKPKVSDRFLSKSGYEKLQFCMEQAKKNGLKYSWVDTCCIDKSSSAELSEAINSMFRWYREAEKCFVYLDIDSVYHFRPEGEKWGIKLEHNRWFTRGWTLQEMLAPETVEFFTRDGIYIGDRSSIQLDLHEITGIPTDALNGRRLLFDFSVEERLSWAEKRETKRPEDMAYCLLGLFDVQMPLIYGEGRAKATKRLMKEIKALEDERLPLAPTISSTRSPRQNPISGIVQPLAPSTENSSKDGPLTSDDDRGIVQFLKMYYERLCRDPDQLGICYQRSSQVSFQLRNSGHVVAKNKTDIIHMLKRCSDQYKLNTATFEISTANSTELDDTHYHVLVFGKMWTKHEEMSMFVHTLVLGRVPGKISDLVHNRFRNPNFFPLYHILSEFFRFSTAPKKVSGDQLDSRSEYHVENLA